MEKISDVLNVHSFSVAKEEKENETYLCPHATEVVNKLFALYYVHCRGFEKQYEDKKKLKMEKTQYIIAFTEKGFISFEKIKFGVKRLSDNPPINTPSMGQFIQWCQPTTDDLGLLTPTQAYKKAFDLISPYTKDDTEKGLGDAQLAIIKHAISETGSYDLRNLPQSKSQPIFERNYEIAVRDYNNGSLKGIAKAITDESVDPGEQSKRDAIANNFKDCCSYETAMPVIRSMLGIPEHGRIPTNTAIGRTLQRIVEANSKDDVREG